MRSRNFVWMALLALSAGTLMGQVQRNVQYKRMGGVAGAAEPPVFVGGANTFQFVAAGPAFGGEVVKNAPYSAEAVTESQQSLADGNKINSKSSTVLYRDSQGRTRTEQKLGALGPWASAGDPPEMIFINDPVTGVQYVLNASEHTARKFEAPPLETLSAKIADGAGTQNVVEWQGATSATAVAGHPGQMIIRGERREIRQGEDGEEQDMTIAVPPTATFTTALSDEKPKTESLGTQVIEGVEATGTRSTITIPAGKIGNERDIEIVSESWFSPQLKTVVLSKHNDPRMGQTTYKLTNVQLVDPLPSLFEVPADYTMEEPAVQMFQRKLLPPGPEPAAAP